MSASRPRGMRVYESIGSGTEARLLRSGDPRYRDVRSAFSLGVFILSTEQGKSALNELARRIIHGLRSGRYACLYPRNDRHFTDLEYWVEFFLDRVNKYPPEVYLTSTPGEALTLRYDWATEQSSLNDFKPELAGHLQMNAMILADMAGASPRRHSGYMFQMAIAVAHEIGHFLTGFLTGGNRPRTPPIVSIPGSRAEAGFFWEYRALQGIVEFYADPRDPENVNQPGIAYLFPDAHESSAGRMVSEEYIERVVSGPYGFQVPIETVIGQPTCTRAQLNRTNNRMSVLRERAARAQPMLMAGASEADRTATRDRYLQRQNAPSQIQQYPVQPRQQYPGQGQQYSGEPQQQYYFQRQDYYRGPNY